jgi:hypothetical protein
MMGTLSNLTLKSLMVCTIQRICEHQLHNQPRWWIVQLKTVFRKTSKREKIQKMVCPRGALSVNPTTCKISIRKTNKIQQRRSKISNPKLRSVFEIPENSPNCRPMRRAWGRLKARTQPHGELNVRPCHCEVQEGADHAPVLSLVHSLAIFIWTKRGRGAHRSRHCDVELLY